ncbi:hypothetical protein [Kitasatospora sp. NPDC015120]|uniref:hypothetical protein n=1 Tax=Kitasatospora sp. NPDC015120 TaxID=3364023 RepID=UPI0036F4882B
MSALVAALSVGALQPAVAGEIAQQEGATDSPWLVDSPLPVPASDPGIIERPAPASGEEADRIRSSLAAVVPAGAQVASVSTETYAEVGQTTTATIVLSGVEVSVTRVRLPHAAPASVFGGKVVKHPGDPKGAIVVDSSPESPQVTVISSSGIATVWSRGHIPESGKHGKTAPSDSQLRSWALAYDELNPQTGVVQRSERMVASQSPSLLSVTCNRLMWAPWTDDGSIYGSATMTCSEWGSINMSGRISQYRALGLWREKASSAILNEWNYQAGLMVQWVCAPGTGNQLYRMELGTASLTVNAGNYWTQDGRYYTEERRYTCG